MTLSRYCVGILFLIIALCVTGGARRHRLPESDNVQNLSITVDGLNRTFILYKPSIVYIQNQRMPLVVVLHGGFGSGKKMFKGIGPTLHRLAERDHFMVAYPDSMNQNWNDGRPVGPGEANDVKFLSDMIDFLIGRFNADPRRVYITGASNGGMMTYRMACDHADKLAAVAPLIGSIPAAYFNRCRPAEPLPILMMNGTEDPFVPWNGGPVKSGRGGEVLPIQKTVQFWVRNNRSNSVPQKQTLPDRVPRDGTRVHVDYYAASPGGADTLLYTIEGGGHTWPGASGQAPPRIVGRKSQDIDATTAIWEFFKKQINN